MCLRICHPKTSHAELLVVYSIAPYVDKILSVILHCSPQQLPYCSWSYWFHPVQIAHERSDIASLKIGSWSCHALKQIQGFSITYWSPENTKVKRVLGKTDVNTGAQKDNQ